MSMTTCANDDGNEDERRMIRRTNCVIIKYNNGVVAGTRRVRRMSNETVRERGRSEDRPIILFVLCRTMLLLIEYKLQTILLFTVGTRLFTPVYNIIIVDNK